MSLFTDSDRRFAETLAELAYCNPFLARRTELERQALGREFDERFAQWNVIGDITADQPNLSRLQARTEAVLARAREASTAGAAASEGRQAFARDIALREDLIWFAIYHR